MSPRHARPDPDESRPQTGTGDAAPAEASAEPVPEAQVTRQDRTTGQGLEAQAVVAGGQPAQAADEQSAPAPGEGTAAPILPGESRAQVLPAETVAGDQRVQADAEPPQPVAALAVQPPAAATRGTARPGAGAAVGRWTAVRKSGARWWYAPLVGVVAVALLVAMFVTARDGSSPTPATTPTPTSSLSPFARQQTLLVQVRNNADVGASNAVLGVGGGLPPAQLLVPSRTIVDVPGAGQQTLGQSARQINRSASQAALSDLLALRVDGTLSLARLALAGMVDYVGGITVNVTRAVKENDKDGKQVVVVPVGTVHLNGTQAAAYALAWLSEEPEEARLARYSDVLTNTISGLPDDQGRIEAMLTSLGGSARTTTATSAVAAFLRRARNDILAGGQKIRVLPTTDIEAFGSLRFVRVDVDGAQAVLHGLLPQAVIPDAEARPRVLVRNGVGTPGLGATARDRLVNAGLVYINGGNADNFNHATTSVLVCDDTAVARELGGKIAQALQVPESAVQVATSGQNVADAVVVLGADFTK